MTAEPMEVADPGQMKDRVCMRHQPTRRRGVPPQLDVADTGAADLRALERLQEGAPLLGPLAVVESVRVRPILRATFSHATIVHVMEGGVAVSTSDDSRLLLAGDVIVHGS